MTGAAGARPRSTGMLLLVPLFWAVAGSSAQSLQWWPEVDLNIERARLDFLLLGQVRLDASQANPQFIATGVLGTWRAARHWDLSAGYLFADLPQSSAVAHVPLAIVTPHLAAGRWSFADANRAERLLDYSDEPYRYRNRAAVDCAVGRERRTHVYVANEV